MELKNKNPQRFYVAASLSDRESGLSFYKSMGWQQELFTGTPDCLQFVGGQSCEPGSPLERMGHVIVSIDKEQHEEIERTGQAGADAVEDIIVDKSKGMVDLVRGLGGPNYFKMQNKTSRATEQDIGGPEDDADPFGRED
jgi:hypothetical protein